MAATCFSAATGQVSLSGNGAALRPRVTFSPSVSKAPTSVHMVSFVRAKSSLSDPRLACLGFCRKSNSGSASIVVSRAFSQDAVPMAQAVEEDGPPEFDIPQGGDEPEGEERFQSFDRGGEIGFAGFTPSPAQDSSRLYVGNIPFDIDSESLANFFKEAGEVVSAEVIYDRESERSKGFGFVSMATAEQANAAVNMFNGSELGGRMLRVNISEIRKGTRRAAPSFGSDSPHRVFVGNLPWTADPELLRETFSRCGEVVGAKVLYDRETGRSRGFGFVSFSSEEEVEAAISELDGSELSGRPIRVDRPKVSEFA